MCLTDAEWRAYNKAYGEAVLAAIRKAQIKELHSFPPSQLRIRQFPGSNAWAYTAWHDRMRTRKETIPKVFYGKKTKKHTTKHSA